MSTFVYTRNLNERLGLKVSLINVDICLYKKLYWKVRSKSFFNKCRHLFIQETLMKGLV